MWCVFTQLHEFINETINETAAEVADPPTQPTAPEVPVTHSAAAEASHVDTISGTADVTSAAQAPTRTYKLPSRRAKPVAAQPPQPPAAVADGAEPAQDQHTDAAAPAAAPEPTATHTANDTAAAAAATSDEGEMVYDLYMPVEEESEGEGACEDMREGVFADWAPPHIPVIEVS